MPELDVDSCATGNNVAPRQLLFVFFLSLSQRQTFEVIHRKTMFIYKAVSGLQLDNYDWSPCFAQILCFSKLL